MIFGIAGPWTGVVELWLMGSFLFRLITGILAPAGAASFLVVDGVVNWCSVRILMFLEPVRSID